MDALLGKTFVVYCISKWSKKSKSERPMYYVENNYPAIISRELFHPLQEEMTRNASKRKMIQKSGKTELGKHSAKYALSELLVCGECCDLQASALGTEREETDRVTVYLAAELSQLPYTG